MAPVTFGEEQIVIVISYKGKEKSFPCSYRSTFWKCNFIMSLSARRSVCYNFPIRAESLASMDLSDHLLFSRAQSTTFGTCLSLTQTFSKQTRKKVFSIFRVRPPPPIFYMRGIALFRVLNPSLPLQPPQPLSIIHNIHRVAIFQGLFFLFICMCYLSMKIQVIDLQYTFTTGFDMMVKISIMYY